MIITRIFNAPLETIWQAWTDPETYKQWMGPKGYTIPVAKIDLRVGGKSLLCMRSSEGDEIWSTGRYLEIVPMEKIVTTDSFADQQGNVVPATHYGMGAEFPLEMQITLQFEDLGKRTKLTLEHVGLPEGKMADLTAAGWNESFDKLDHLVNRKCPSVAPA